MGICKQTMTKGQAGYKKNKAKGVVSILIRLTKKEKEELNDAVRLSGESQNNFILYAVQEKIKLQRELIT